MSEALMEVLAKTIAQSAIDEHNVASTTPLGAFSFARNMDGNGVMWEHFTTDAQAVIAAIEAAGFRVVPVEPTQEMIEAMDKLDWSDHRWPAQPPEVWSAMLSAAPKIKEGGE